jgi:hypothetical protein
MPQEIGAAKSRDPMRAALRQFHPKGDKGSKASLRSGQYLTIVSLNEQQHGDTK